MPTLAEEFGIDMGIIPSSTMLPAPVQHLSVPFVSARARIAEFERLREQIRRTDIVREMQVERLHALACEPPYEFNRPQVRLFVSPPPPPLSPSLLSLVPYMRLHGV